jgi:signal transduction histidine kinase
MPSRPDPWFGIPDIDETPTPTVPSVAAVLVVDSDERNLQATRNAFEDHAYDLVLARSGAEALLLLLDRDFAVILLEVHMPEMDGFATARLIRGRARTRHTPIIFVTANRQDDAEVREGYALGAVDFLFEPIIPAVLEAKVGVFVELQRRTDRLRRVERRSHARRLAEERQRWEADALRLESARKDEFLALLAHELRNPLTPIVLALRLLRRVKEPELASCVDAMDRQVRHLTRLVDDLLDIGRITSGHIALQPRPADLGAIVRQAVEATAAIVGERGHRLVVDGPTGAVSVVVDADRLVQVVSNLLSNAARYTEPGGHLEATYGVDGDEAWVRVRDDGRGIPKEVLPQVFEMFYQERRTGLGLGVGLALVKKLVELHGGSVEARSEGIGKGSTFLVRFAATREPVQPPVAPQPVPRRTARILLVDDDDDVRLVTAEVLRSHGHLVDEARDGPSALLRATEGLPDVILLDLAMPGHDGYETAAMLRGRLGARTPPLVALSGFGAAADRARTTDAAFAAHILKPVPPDELLAIIGAVAARPAR